MTHDERTSPTNLYVEQEEQTIGSYQVDRCGYVPGGGYRCRLTFFQGSPGFVQTAEEYLSFQIENGPRLTLAARDAKQLARARRFHIESYGYTDEESARAAGEHLRFRLQLLNSLLGLGFAVPMTDNTSSSYSEAVKAEALRESDTIILDSIMGLSVHPDDGRHVELVMAIDAENHPNDPLYLLKNLDKIWNLDITLDEKSKVALEIVGRATADTSPRTRFLLLYFACECLLDRPSRSKEAKALIEKFVDQVEAAALDPKDAMSLKGALHSLLEQSFSSVLKRYVETISSPAEIFSIPTQKFIAKCISTRNNLAHNAAVPPDGELETLAKGLRYFVMALIWTRNKIPSLTLNEPVSQISFPPDKMSFKAM